MRLLITPACAAADLADAAHPSHLLRLVSPDQPATDAHAPATLTLIMHDIAAAQPGRIAPDAAMMRALLDFSAGWTGAHPLLVQCWAGVSRSPAAAFIIACQKRSDLPERSIAAALRQAAPQATPNALMVHHADALLARAGRMSAAIAAIGRGAEFTRFACAELDLEFGAAGPGAATASAARRNSPSDTRPARCSSTR